ncbi:MAG: NOL1/NOP2/sun family putative RNA methylase [Candidatus Woesearchaeota archaeon]
MKEEIEFKKAFIERYSKLTNFDLFSDYSLRFLRRSIRVNTLKISINDLKKRIQTEWNLTQIPWCSEGFWIKHKGTRKDIGNLIEHVLGYIFVQEAASMIPPIVLNPKPNEKVLDLCASPGSKTTQIAQYMENTGILIANDFKFDRNKALSLNLQRMGVLNVIMTLKDATKIKNYTKNEFDKILVDAPCSGTGAIRKSLKTIKIWNPNMITKLATTQKIILENAFNLLKKGGSLVYSTCSVEPEENEGVINFLVEKYKNAKVEKINLDIIKSEPILEFNGVKYNNQVKKSLRIWPQDNDTEGFFICKIKKN